MNNTRDRQPTKEGGVVVVIDRSRRRAASGNFSIAYRSIVRGIAAAYRARNRSSAFRDRLPTSRSVQPTALLDEIVGILEQEPRELQRVVELTFAGDASDFNSLATARAVSVGIVAIEQW
jgi:hypothetical protein